MNNLQYFFQILSKLKLTPNKSYYSYQVNRFNLKIYTHRIQEHPVQFKDDKITNYDILDVYLFEEDNPIDLEKDTRFKDYQPIKYSKWVGYNSGVEMPISNLLELMKYLYVLLNLTVYL